MMPTYQFPIKYPDKDPLPHWSFIIWVIIVMLIVVMICLGVANAQEIDLSIIGQIESNNNPLAFSPAGAIGTYQIMPIVLEEYNIIFDTYYRRQDLFDELLNFTIAQWYLTQRIPQMLRCYHKPVTLDNVLWAYNAGIGNLVKGIKPLETRNYINKYKRLAGVK